MYWCIIIVEVEEGGREGERVGGREGERVGGRHPHIILFFLPIILFSNSQNDPLLFL